MPSPIYHLFGQAMASRKQILCMYGGYHRELCPIILGHSQGQAKALTYQFGGQSKSGLPPGGEWRCLWLSKVSNVELRDGRWHAGSSHTQPQGCVEIVDLDINPSVRTTQNAESKSPATASPAPFSNPDSVSPASLCNAIPVLAPLLRARQNASESE